MHRYIIERDLPGAGTLTSEQLRHASGVSRSTLDALGTGIQWVRSYVTADRIYCEYLATSEALVRTHASRAGLPATQVSLVTATIDPLTANDA